MYVRQWLSSLAAAMAETELSELIANSYRSSTGALDNTRSERLIISSTRLLCWSIRVSGDDELRVRDPCNPKSLRNTDGPVLIASASVP